MWFWGHAAVGYLGYYAARRYWSRLPGGDVHDRTLAGLLLGTQLPDLIDKPLAWWLGVLPAGRSLLHSLVVVLPLAAVTVWAGRRVGRGSAATGLVAGVLSHVLVDPLPQLAAGEFADLPYLAWPLLPAPPYDVGTGFSTHFRAIDLGPGTLFEVGLTVLALGLAVHEHRRA
ncbi:MAG: metal-dependent hydrolase [Halobacteriaceae archaeon]